MRIKKELTVIAIVLSLATSQTGWGMVAGLISGFGPLAIAGATIVAGGACFGTGFLIVGDDVGVRIGLGLMFLGGILDSENPGRADVLNDLPMTAEVAKNAGVKLTDIKSYNRNLDQVRRAGLELAEDIRQQIKRKSEFNQYRNQDELSRDPQIENLAVKYGFENGSELLKSFNCKKLPTIYLKKFADNQNLTQGEAKLLFYYGFGVQSE